ncbi:MAG: hypothetical protein HZB79_10310 [Deltaproteobacteria bacterium]|nr:hypothetical protein [Deltaproteobacteria bacterium]
MTQYRKKKTQRLNAEHLISDYYKLEKKLGRQPSCGEYSRECHGNLILDCVFGKPGWKSFLKVLGKNVLQEHTLSKEHLIEDYYSLERELGRQPNAAEYFIKHHNNTVLQRVFGKPGWQFFLKAMGKNLLIEMNLSPQHLIEDYNELERKLGKQPTCTEYISLCHSIHTLGRVFGKPGWSMFLKSIGKTKYRVNSEILINDYYDLEKKLGRQPSATEYVQEKHHGFASLERIFGKPAWRNFLKSLGRNVLQEKNIEREHLMQDYYSLWKETGRKPTFRGYEKKHHSKCVLNRVFGKSNEESGWEKLKKIIQVTSI